MAKMMGRLSRGGVTYGIGTGRMKRCFCWRECLYDWGRGRQRRTEKREWMRDQLAQDIDEMRRELTRAWSEQ